MNDNHCVNIEHAQIMSCTLCYIGRLKSLHSRTKEIKELTSYFKANGITSPRKHNNAYHAIVAKRLEEEVNNLMNEKEER